MSTTTQPQATQPSIGPFKALGMLFGMLGTAIGTANKGLLVVDESVTVVHTNVVKAGEAIDIVVNGALADFANDELVNDAKRKIARATAEAEAKTIIANLKTP